MTYTGHRNLWAKIMVVIGSIGLLVGALDPLEGSILILIGSGLAALGTLFGQAEPRLVRYRTLVFVLIVLGAGAMWGLSARGGIGGKSGLSMWWGLLLLPYLIGYPMAITGPGHPRWFLCLGIGVGLWYLALGCIISHSSKGFPDPIVILLAAIGLAMIGGCVIRLVSAARHARAISPARPQ